MHPLRRRWDHALDSSAKTQRSLHRADAGWFTLRSMTHTLIPLTPLPEPPAVTCSTCAACCCQLEVILLGDTGVPQRYITLDDWGGETMLRLDDGWCAALDRDSMLCTIYAQRPLVCREFEMGAPECLDERQGISSAYR